jgi:hypothetical protein
VRQLKKGAQIIRLSCMTALNKITQFLKQSYRYLPTTNTKEWCVRRFRFYLIVGDVQDDEFPWLKPAWSNHFEPLLIPGKKAEEIVTCSNPHLTTAMG